MKLSDLDLDLRLPKPPLLLVAVMVIGAFVPMGIASAIWYKRNAFDPNPRIHLFQDMDNQARLNPQAANGVFADGRAMRAYPPGTVAFSRTTHAPDPDMLKDDDLAYRGFVVDPETGELDGEPVYLDGFPDIVEVDTAFVLRGQERFNIFCMTCHGEDGQGVGPTKVRWDELVVQEDTGTRALIPANLMNENFALGQYTNGQLFDTISRGKGSMGAIGQQIPVRDRWAIIAWVRAMQHHNASGQAETEAEAEAQPAQ